MKNFKTVLALLLSFGLVAALAGCGGEKASSGGVVGGGSQGQTVINLQLVAEAEVAAGEALQLEIPVLTENADNGIIAGFTDDINAKLADWQQALGEGETMLVQALTLETENYLSVVLTKSVAPNYGSDGEVYSYVYDKIIDNAMNEDLALSIGGMTDDMIAEALQNYLSADQKWINFTLEGYAMAEDGKPVYFIRTEVEQDGAENWSYLLVLKNGEIYGNMGQLIEDIGKN